MKEYFSYGLTIILVFILSSTLFAAMPREQQVTLWSDLVEAKQNPSFNKLGTWHAIEGMTLIKKVEDTSLKAAALATIIHYYDVKDKIWYGKQIDDETTAAWSARKKILLEDVEKNADKYHRHLDELYKERDTTRRDVRDKKYTSGVGTALVMEKYLRRNRNDLVRAARDFAANRGLAVDVIVREYLRFDEIAGFLDNDNPIIIHETATDNFLICVGYIRSSTEEYLITVDLNKIMFAEVSRASLVIGKGKLAKRVKEISEEDDKRFGLLKDDQKLNLKGALQIGIEITDYRQGDYTVYVIKNFKLTEASFEKYLKLLKEQ